MGQSLGFLGLHFFVKLPPSVVAGLSDLKGTADIGDGLALSPELLSGFDIAEDLLGCVADSFHGGVPSLVWPVVDSHSPWAGLWGPHPYWIINDDCMKIMFVSATANNAYSDYQDAISVPNMRFCLHEHEQWR
jgi:hypothetical protein